LRLKSFGKNTNDCKNLLQTRTVDAAPESLPTGVRIEAAAIMDPSAAETTGEADPVVEVGVAGDELPAEVHVQAVPVVEPTANGADASTSAAEVAPTQLDVDDEEEEAYVWTEGGITALEQVPHVYIEAGWPTVGSRVPEDFRESGNPRVRGRTALASAGSGSQRRIFYATTRTASWRN